MCLAEHAAVRLPAYSTIKVLPAAAFWRAVARGELSEAEPYVLQRRGSVGGGALRGFRHAAELGLRQTTMRRLMRDAEAVSEGRDNYTSAEDLATLLQELATARPRGQPRPLESKRGANLANAEREG